MIRANRTVAILIAKYAGLAETSVAAAIAPVVLGDPDDDQVLACALAARADLIVSGDRDLLQLKHYHDIPIVTPAEALTRLPRK